MKKWTVISKHKPKGNEYTKKLGISDEISQIMTNRNISECDDINMYINPSFELLRDPFLLKDMDKAVERIEAAISNSEKICIYGDYDVDGVSSTSLMMIYFDSIDYPVEYYIPNRLEEGYGLNNEAIDQIKKLDVDLILTVDCGITSVNEVEYAKELGIDVIITDHHECQNELPNAYAVVDHKRPDCEYPFKGLCGCGIAFKLIHALSGDKVFKENIDNYLEITSLATICDIMPVLDENRIIVKNGLKIIGKGNNIGMKALVEICGLEGITLKSSHLGFSLGPRINASGRLGSSSLGVELFTAKSAEKAEELAAEMDIKNEQRQLIEATMYNEAEKMINDNPEFENDKVIVLGKEGWHHGIIGIVASKITEKYYKPCVLLCIEDDLAVGSGRSIKGFNLFEALYECKEYMVKFGGHEQAAGMTVKAEDIDKLRIEINKIALDKLHEEDLVEEIKIEYEIDERRINLDFVDELHVLEPFGIKNATPYFVLRECYIKNTYLLGKDKRHLKIVIEKNEEFECIGFGMGYLYNEFKSGDIVDMVFQVGENRYNGNVKVQLLIKDIRMFSPSDITTFSKALKATEKIVDVDCSLHNGITTEKLKSLEKEEYYVEYKDMIKNKKNKRYQDIISEADDGDLIIVNTLNGFFRAMSDINIAKKEKIDCIFISNIEKTDLKRYNKIIIYDYLDSLTQLEFIYKRKNEFSKIIFNFNNGDFLYLKNKLDEMQFNRENFVVIYKYLNSMDSGEIRYSKLIKLLKLTPIKFLIGLKVMESEKLLEYSINYKDDILEFNILPKPSKKLNLENNEIVKSIKSIIKEFKTTYGVS
ncbi:single-stranded-DNA-specific exonuclease RecJ [Peptostreptococcus faecalis]|uniref:single-stranded-DNA-specific exonuclease RecJ n=1 Tax=Peptostreptococcus faecalis TaxID=2045015 RepID=UPI000C7D4F33|nr:single-stranded-DNA-specific exonuclease RecJ [Peptostreptococcus faecalis]